MISTTTKRGGKSSWKYTLAANWDLCPVGTSTEPTRFWGAEKVALIRTAIVERPKDSGGLAAPHFLLVG